MCFRAVFELDIDGIDGTDGTDGLDQIDGLDGIDLLPKKLIGYKKGGCVLSNTAPLSQNSNRIRIT